MKPPNQIESGIAALHTATAALRALGIEILSAAASSNRDPEIHIVDPGPIPQTTRYVRCVLDRSTHYAMPYLGCQLIWIEPPVVPGAAPTQFTDHKRTSEHG